MPLENMRGVAWVVSGPTATATSILDPGKEAMATIRGDDGKDDFGLGMDTAGDLDADGVDDLAITAPAYDGDGAAFVFYGPLSGYLTGDDAGFRILGEMNEYAGSLVRYVDDLDGDGATELALVSGHPNYFDGECLVTLWYGGGL